MQRVISGILVYKNVQCINRLNIICNYTILTVWLFCTEKYKKEHVPLICKPNLTPLDECLVCELKIGNKNVL